MRWPLRRALVLLVLPGCVRAPEDALRLAVTLRPSTAVTLVGGALVGFPVRYEDGTQWALYGARLRGCDEGGRPPVDPPPWTVGFAAPQRLRCEPVEGASSCGVVGADPFCCTRPRLPVASWCAIDLVADLWAPEEEDGPPPGAAVIEAEVEETGGTLDAWIELPHLGVADTVSLVTTRDEVRVVNGRRQETQVAEPLIFELGGNGWMAPAWPALLAGEAVVVRPGDALHDALRASLSGAALYPDLDDDGYVDDEERASPRGTVTPL